ncbi:septum formation initiator [Natranaerovirga pectinivora]|uniref:Septum formation initiator n=1 Tax=Natranaerovirga pectinivora TaxID=682400 RepID=A0A4V2UZX8_9FIRM|nr:septum formation initiator family protein [Natranaerovirga pectinivora]TCT13049.1 septum formation initiator [Natranaerovirga pectinivora]
MKRKIIPRGTAPIIVILFVLITVIVIKISTLYEENKELKNQETRLLNIIESEQERQELIKERQEYMNKTDYIEEVAREMFGLIKENELLIVPQK